MITIRTGNGAIGICLLLLVTGCSREQQDWRSAEAADSIEGYSQFIQRHPESELAAQARTRVGQLGEDRDWQRAGSADTVDAYRDFIAQHPNGKWEQEARIRIQNFSLGEQTGTDAASKGVAGSGSGADAGVGRADAGVSSGNAVADPGAGRARGLAAPGEAAMPVAQLASASASGPTGTPGGTKSRGGAGGAASGRAGPGGEVRGAPGGAARGGASGVANGGTGGAAGGGARGPVAGSFGIQLGAFSSEMAANNEWRLLTGRFGPELQGLNEHVVTADKPSGRVYRLQAVIGDEARARAICDSLRKRSQACVAVLPH